MCDVALMGCLSMYDDTVDDYANGAMILGMMVTIYEGTQLTWLYIASIALLSV